MPDYYRQFCNSLILVLGILVFPAGAVSAGNWQTESNSKQSAGDNGNDKQEATPAAWEYRPYQVVVWLAHNDSWRVRGVEQLLTQRISELAKLTDPSAWRVNVKRAPNPWNWRMQGDFDHTIYSDELHADIGNVGDDQIVDKLIVVYIDDQLGAFETTVREFDLKTKVWGAKVIRRSQLNNIDDVVFQSIKTAFMPITRIEKVTESEERVGSDVRVRVRAIDVAKRAERDENGEWSMVDNTGSPAWIGDDEILMPVFIRHDRRGNLDTITPTAWTFLSIIERDRAHLTCTTHSMGRAPLEQRIGGSTERIGLCVRAPNRPTTLKLISNDKERLPLPDLEILSRGPHQPAEEESDPLGKTDWRGEIVIPPNDDSIRILLVKSGRRPLARVPIVPGLYDHQMTTMPNDETRLYAEGITRGLFNELMDNFARRQILTVEIETALEKGDLDRVNDLLKLMRNVPTSQEFNAHLNQERSKLIMGDDRQQEIIDGYFDELIKASSKFLNGRRESELTREYQDARKF